MNRCSFLIGFLCCFKVAVTQVPGKQPVLGMGSYSERRSDVFSFVHNQAALAFLKKPSAGCYGERRFFLNALADYCMAVAIPVQTGAIGMELARFGFSDYSLTRAGVAYGRSLGKSVQLGLQFNYSMISIPAYAKNAAPGVELGVLLQLTDKLKAGIHVANPGGIRYTNHDKQPAIFTAGMGYDVSEKFFFYSEFVREEMQMLRLNAGFHYAFSSLLFLRAGVSTDNNCFWWSAGYMLKLLRLDMTFKYQQPLGVTPGLAVLFHFQSKQK